MAGPIEGRSSACAISPSGTSAACKGGHHGCGRDCSDAVVALLPHEHISSAIHCHASGEVKGCTASASAIGIARAASASKGGHSAKWRDLAHHVVGKVCHIQCAPCICGEALRLIEACADASTIHPGGRAAPRKGASDARRGYAPDAIVCRVRAENVGNEWVHGHPRGRMKAGARASALHKLRRAITSQCDHSACRHPSYFVTAIVRHIHCTRCIHGYTQGAGEH